MHFAVVAFRRCQSAAGQQVNIWCLPIEWPVLTVILFLLFAEPSGVRVRSCWAPSSPMHSRMMSAWICTVLPHQTSRVAAFSTISSWIRRTGNRAKSKNVHCPPRWWNLPPKSWNSSDWRLITMWHWKCSKTTRSNANNCLAFRDMVWMDISTFVFLYRRLLFVFCVLFTFIFLCRLCAIVPHRWLYWHQSRTDDFQHATLGPSINYGGASNCRWCGRFHVLSCPGRRFTERHHYQSFCVQHSGETLLKFGNFELYRTQFKFECATLTCLLLQIFRFVITEPSTVTQWTLRGTNVIRKTNGIEQQIYSIS